MGVSPNYSEILSEILQTLVLKRDRHIGCHDISESQEFAVTHLFFFRFLMVVYSIANFFVAQRPPAAESK